jgi:hypothetical protein
LTILLLTVTAQAAAPVGQTIWIRASANGLFVSADQNRGTWAPLVADRSSVDAWEQFQVIDAGGGFIAFRSIGTGLFVSADQARATFAPLVADRATIGTWEQFTWTDLPVAPSLSEEERPTVSFRLISPADHLLHWCLTARQRYMGAVYVGRSWHTAARGSASGIFSIGLVR